MIDTLSGEESPTLRHAPTVSGDREVHWEDRQQAEQTINERHIRQTVTSVKSCWVIRVTS